MVEKPDHVDGFLEEGTEDLIPIDEDHFPNAAFRDIVKSGVDTNHDDYLSAGEIAAITEFYFYNRGLTDLTGIGYFTSLKSLNCNQNNLTGLDLSGCTALETLHCQGNKLTNLNLSGLSKLRTIYGTSNKLESLNLSGCVALESLDCSNSALTSVDLSDCSKLKVIGLYNNQLQDLDVSMCSQLELLSCGGNQLTSLDVTASPDISLLYCVGNQIAKLDISRNKNLVYIYHYGEQTIYEDSFIQYSSDWYTLSVDLTTEVIDQVLIDETNFPDPVFRQYVLDNIDTDKDEKLSDAEINSITEINVQLLGIGNLKGIKIFKCLERLLCDGNQLTSLDLSGCIYLTFLSCSLNPLTEGLDVSGCMYLSEINCCTCQLSNLDVSGCTYLATLACYGNNLETLDVKDCKNLKKLECFSNKLTSLDVSGCMNLQKLDCDNNQLTGLDVSDCTALAELTCGSNQLTALDLSQCTMLTELYCNSNQLQSLDVSGCSVLKELFCGNNPMPNLDLSKSATLLVLSCGNGQMTSLDLSGCTALEELSVRESQLTSLDVSGHTALKFIYAMKNKLTSLNVSGCTALISIECNSNELTSLDVSGCPALSSLTCSDNQLTALDLSNCSNLLDLSCANNQLTSLDVSSCTALKSLSCYLNPIGKLDIRNNENLVNAFCNGVRAETLDSFSYVKLIDLDIMYILMVGKTTEVIARTPVTEVFDDIPEGAWFVKAVQYVYDNNIMGGKGASFKPNDPITREEFVRVLYNHAGTPEVTIANPFADVKAGAWYEKSVLWAKENNIANGKTKDGKYIFGVGQQIRREELARMIYMYAQLKGYKTDKDDTAIDKFSDAGKVSPWAKDAMNWAVSQGVMGGKGGKLDPQGMATRAECASMIKNMIEKTVPIVTVGEK